MNDSLRSSRSYRPDIDGLRAVAVLSVVVFHLDKSLLPGGFIGVDLFFVISGFLITRNIVEELERGRFSIAGFYQRRIKRIAPALLVVVAATLIAAELLMLPEDARTAAKSAVWSIFSMANVYFWLYQDTGYFAANSAELPLLHLWSLGVEEQFYIVWPLLLAGAYRTRFRKALFPIAVAATFISFGLASVLARHAPSFAYYMLPTRAGELLLGALLAIAVLSGMDKRIPAAVVSMSGIVGLALLTASLILVTEDLPLPGWFAVPATLGAALTILAGQHPNNLATRALSAQPLVWIGLISYSAYLWHWPLIALWRYGYGPLHARPGWAIFALTLLLAWASYRLVEQPARRARSPTLRRVLGQYSTAAACVLAAALVVVYAGRAGLALHSKTYLAALEGVQGQTRPAYLLDWVCQRQLILEQDMRDERCVLGMKSTDAPVAILWGDSNAAHYVGMLNAFAQEAGFRFRNVEVGSCPPVYADPGSFVESRRTNDCKQSLKVIQPAIEGYSVVIISSSWSSYGTGRFIETFFETVRSLTQQGKTVVLIGKAPIIRGYDRLCREKALSYPFLDCPFNTAPLSAEVAEINAKLRHFAEETAHVQYFDANEYLCPAGTCSAFDASGRPKYVDESHLTFAASSQLGEEIITRHGVPKEFASIGRFAASSRQIQAPPVPKSE